VPFSTIKTCVQIVLETRKKVPIILVEADLAKLQYEISWMDDEQPRPGLLSHCIKNFRRKHFKRKVILKYHFVLFFISHYLCFDRGEKRCIWLDPGHTLKKMCTSFTTRRKLKYAIKN